MNKKTKGTIFSVILILIVVILVGYDVIGVHIQKIKVQKQIEEQEKLEEEKIKLIEEKKKELELKKEKTIIEIVEFDEKYKVIESEFFDKIARLPDVLNEKFINIDQLEEITIRRISYSKEFKKKLFQIENIPEPLEDFYNFKVDFLNNDIETYTLLNDYYTGKSYYSSNNSKIKDSFYNNILLFSKAEEERTKVYKANNLDYLLE
jgi:uncharacterized protein YneF (UPF0154 family)